MIAQRKRERWLKMKKAMGMFVSLMIALSMTGVAYATWTDMVTIKGTVNMGDMVVGWEEILFCDDSDLHLDPPKEVADVDCQLKDPEEGKHHEPIQTVYHTLEIAIKNAYPEYWALCKVTLKNAGTVPAHIIDVIMRPGAGLHITTTFYDPGGNPVGWELNDDITGLPVLNVYVYKQETKMSLVCNQLDPCTAEPVDIRIDVKETAEECHTYTFSIEYAAVNWNES